MSLLDNQPFNDSDTSLRGSAFLHIEAISQGMREAKNNMVALLGQSSPARIPRLTLVYGKKTNTTQQLGSRLN